MPTLEHRFCVKHLYANVNGKGYNGKQFEDALWGAGRAANENQFKNYLFVISGMSGDVFNYFEKIDPRM
jgi:hypothetical protein